MSRAETSLPARGVWIEIYAHLAEDAGECGRSPQGECGLKFEEHAPRPVGLCRSPQGECGLK